MMAIHRDRSVADLKGRRTYFNHCFTASFSPPSRLAHPLLSLYYVFTYPPTNTNNETPTNPLPFLYYVFAYPPNILVLSLRISLCPGAYFQLDYADPRAYPSQICTNLFALSSLPHANLHVIRMLCRF